MVEKSSSDFLRATVEIGGMSFWFAYENKPELPPEKVADSIAKLIGGTILHHYNKQ